MSRQAEPSVLAGRLDAAALEARGYKRCEHCGGLLPLSVSRCRRRRCPGYAATWARDTMRKIRENLRSYGGLVAMCTLTAPGEAAGLVWDRENCTHPAEVRCDGKKGCTVVPAAAELWNDQSRAWWRELNRRAKLRADRAIKHLGHDYKGGLLMYEWELQRRGVWHLHFILGMETAVERMWGVRVRAGDAGARAGLVLRLCRRETPPLTPILNFVSRRLTGRSGITMRVLRDFRLAWAWREGHLPDDVLEPFDLLHALCLLERFSAAARAP